MEKPDIIETEDFYRIAGKSFADYLGYPSFQEYLRRSSYFLANLTRNQIREAHLGELFKNTAGSEHTHAYDDFTAMLLDQLKPRDTEDHTLFDFFKREELKRLLESGEDFVSADGDCGENGSARILVSCELKKTDGEVYGLFLIHDISGLYDPHSLARKYAEYDPLTKLFSRHAADSYGKEYFNLHPEDHAALVLIEVDRFKDFNDRYGHHIGDLVLRSIAVELQNYFGSHAIIGRNAGQEFLVLIKDRSAEAVEEELRTFSESVHQLEHEGTTYSYEFSIGYCLYPEQGILYHDLARKADKAKYNIRLGGGNGYCKFEDDMINLNNF